MVGQGEEGGDAGADHGEGRRRDDRKETLSGWCDAVEKERLFNNTPGGFAFPPYPLLTPSSLVKRFLATTCRAGCGASSGLTIAAVPVRSCG